METHIQPSQVSTQTYIHGHAYTDRHKEIHTYKTLRSICDSIQKHTNIKTHTNTYTHTICSWFCWFSRDVIASPELCPHLIQAKIKKIYLESESQTVGRSCRVRRRVGSSAITELSRVGNTSRKATFSLVPRELGPEWVELTQAPSKRVWGGKKVLSQPGHGWFFLPRWILATGQGSPRIRHHKQGFLVLSSLKDAFL